jgi:putative hydrolase of the HAD superfamily
VSGAAAVSPIRAVLWDFGGVILSSPFEAFAHYEQRNGLPAGAIRHINSTNHHDNAWALLERNEVTFEQFCDLFEAEGAELGYPVDAREVLGLLSGDVRPEMVEAVRLCKQRCKTALLTNNFVSDQQRPDVAEILALFDVIVESSKVGVRKPSPAFYQLACDALGIEPHEAVFLDDLGINLKPAKELGMQTIKVVDPADALQELEAVVGFPVRAGQSAP